MHRPGWNMDRGLCQLDQPRLDLTLDHRLAHLALYLESLTLEGVYDRHPAYSLYSLFVQKEWNEIRWDQALERLRQWGEVGLEQGE